MLPGVAAGAGVSLVVFPTLIDRPWIVIGALISAFVIPLVLEATRVWSSTWDIVNDQLVVSSTTLRLDGTAAVVFLVTTSIALIIVVPLLVRTVAASARDSRRQLEIQAWHLGHLLPESPLSTNTRA